MTVTTNISPDIVCGGCANAIRTALKQLPGITKVAVDTISKTVTVTHDEAKATPQSVTDTIEKAGFTVS